MMNSSHIFLCCLFTVALYFLSHHTSSSVEDVVPKPVRKLSMSIPALKHEYHKIKEEDEAMESSLEYASNSNDLVYHVDYNGVATHPIPKHPKP